MTPLRTFSGLFCTLLLISSLPVSSQEISDERHQIEVIIFQQTDPFGAEGFAIDPELAYPEPFTLLSQAPTLFPAPPVADDYPGYLASLMVPQKFLNRKAYLAPESFIELDKSQRQLNPDAFTLTRNGNYRILAHKAWQQPLNSRKRSPWIILHGGRQVAGHFELEGSIRIFQSRFTHVETFFWLSQFTPPKKEVTDEPPAEDVALPSPVILPPVPQPPAWPERAFIESLLMVENEVDDYAESKEITTVTVEPTVNVSAIDVLHTSEQIRRKSVHYIDHPRMGILVLVTPIESDESELDDENDLNAD